jgi:hypothetical protein
MIIMNRFLKRFAQGLAGIEDSELTWGQEVERLPEAPTTLLADESLLSGEKYQKTVAEVLGDMAKHQPVSLFHCELLHLNVLLISAIALLWRQTASTRSRSGGGHQVYVHRRRIREDIQIC